MIRFLKLTAACVTLLTASSALAGDVEWDVLPNGLMEVTVHEPFRDRVELHRIMRSEFTAQPSEEVKGQAVEDGLWVFLVEYGKDRFAYFIEVEPARVEYSER